VSKAHALTEHERERVYQGLLQEKTYEEIAQEIGRSWLTVRKWAHRFRKEGLDGLRTRERGRPKTGFLGTYPEELRDEALRLKQAHRKWGARRVLVNLQEQFPQERLPDPSLLARFFKVRCPEAVAKHEKRPKRPVVIRATAVHEVWQLDIREMIRLRDGDLAAICDLRDTYGAAILASVAISIKKGESFRRPTWQELQAVFRRGFVEMGTLPDCILTDNQLVLTTNAFPSKLTLWLKGLGVAHRFIRPHRPTDQAQIERTHRTLDGFAIDDQSLENLQTLQAALERERIVHNTKFPSRASDCEGRPPLVAHPELLIPRRPYALDEEYRLFSLQRVYDHLAALPSFQRTVLSNGQFSLGNFRYSIGKKWARQTVSVSCDPCTGEWVVSCLDAHTVPQDIARRAIKGLDLEVLPMPSRSNVPPLQLTLPSYT
jgi:transposase InsO family protein